ncbi:MAG: helix-turn-helix domain-containing protein [Acetanaerobacterium sp.]
MFAKKLRTLRKESGYTQGQLGKLLGISTSAVGMYEQGRREPDGAMLLRICSVFSVNADYLLGESASREVRSPLLLEDIIADMREVLLTQKALMFHGKPVDAEGTQKIIDALELGAQRARVLSEKNRGENG